MNANIRIWRLRRCSRLFVDVTEVSEVAGAGGGVGVGGVVAAARDSTNSKARGAIAGAGDVAVDTQDTRAAALAFLVASSMLFLASLNFISTFPNSAFNKRSCVSIDSFSAAALEFFDFRFDGAFPEVPVAAEAF